MSNRKKLWFGTIVNSRWVTTPNQGANMTPTGWSSGGTFLGGGAYERHSWGTHMEYVFEWPDSSSREAAQLMRSYRSGTFGRGLIYFVDPLIYDTNILPARWGDPSIAILDEGAPMVYGSYPEGVITSGGEANDLPVTSAYYNLDNVSEGYRTDQETLFIPIPEGYTLYLGAIFQATGTGGVFVTEVDSAGNNGSTTALTPVATDATDLVPETFSGGAGVRLWAGKSSAGASSVTITAMTARLYQTGETPPASFSSGPWIGGMGHSGCKFKGVPTYIANSGVEGGRIGYAATFVEVGDWS